MASGESKQEVLSSILNREGSSKKYPASKISQQHGKMDWYLDAASAEKI
jgi:6-phosphogluconolactonase/glucosamine-6-phosphate isomerase/deaminase